MRKTFAAFAIAAGAILSQPVMAQGADDRAPIKVTTTGAAAQGFFAVVIEAMHAIYRDAYPGSTVTFQPNSVGGGMLAVAAGQADISIGLPPVEIQRALAGQEPFQASLDGKFMHVMTILEDLDFVFAANKEWADKNGVKSFADLARTKAKVRFGASNRATFYINVVMEGIMKEYGYSFRDLESWGGKVFYNASGPTIQDLRDGKLDAMVSGGLQPDRRLQDVHNAMPLVWLRADKAVMEKVAAELDMQVVPMPKGAYTFVEQDEWNIRAPTVMAAGAHVPELTVYKMVKALHQNLERVRAIHPSFRDFTLAQMAKPSPKLPFHPGAARYYREQGVLK